MKQARPLLAAAVALAALAGGCSSPRGEDPSLLVGRLWSERTPEKPTDYIHGALLLPRPAIGLFHRSSAYDFHFERFDYQRDGKTLNVTFPQTGRKVSVSFAVTACDELPPFDLCLDLGASPWEGPKRYYSKRKVDDDDAETAAMKAHLAR